MDPWIAGTVAVHRIDETTMVLRIEGEHDLTTAAAVRGALDGVADGQGVVVDLSACSFVDSSIIAALLHGRRARTAFATVLPPQPDGTVTRALEVTGVAPLLGCCASLEEARRILLAAADGQSRDGDGGETT